MSDNYVLEGRLRKKAGKGAARELRRNAMVPCIIYGDKKPPVSISLPQKELETKIRRGGFMTTIATLDIENEKYRVLPKEYQLHPVRDFVQHVALKIPNLVQVLNVVVF